MASDGLAIDVRSDFGAKGDGTTDDTTAIQSAFNFAALTGRTVLFPDGDYLIMSGLTINQAAAFTVNGSRSGVVGSYANKGGAWLRWGSVSAGTIVTLTGCENVTWQGVGFHGNNLADGMLIQSSAGNSPVSTVHAYRDFSIYRCVNGIYINKAADGSESDQMIFESVRMNEIVTAGVVANSVNVTTVVFERCTTIMASSNDNVISYDLRECSMVKIVDCNGGYGQDFVRLGYYAQGVTIDNSQSEGSTNANRAFLRVGASGDTGLNDTTVIRNCIPDNAVILAGPTRKILSLANTWHASSSISITASDARFLSYAEVLPSGISVTGTNAMLRQIDTDNVNGGTTPTLATGTGSTAMSVTGNTFRGQVTFTTAANLAADSEAVAVVPNPSLGTGTLVTLTPANAAAAAAGAYVGNIASSQWGLNLHTPPAVATVLTFNYSAG